MSDLKQVVDAVSGALGVIKTVADTPGINLIPYVSTVSAAIGALQAAVAVGKSVAPYVTAITDTFGNGKKIPTESELAALDARIAELEKEAYAPLPPKEEGEDD